MNIRFKLNGKQVSLESEPQKKALEILKELGINSVRKGCDEEGKCGNCTILLGGKTVNSCMLLAAQMDGREILTVEGLSKGRRLHPIQKAFIDAGVVQCGYCTPAQILAVKALLDRTKSPTRDEITDALSGVLCRCTGYKQLFNVFDILSKGKRPQDFTPEYKKSYRVVGKITPKIDAEQLVRAEDSFVEDLITRDTLHVYLLTSPHPHAEIVSIDTAEAQEVPGVEYILTHKNSPKTFYTPAGQTYPEPSPYDRQVIGRKMRFIGDRVAAVAATSRETARTAAGKIKVKYRLLKPVLTVEEARRRGAPIIHDRDTSLDPLDIGGDPKRNLVCFTRGGLGDVEKGLRAARVVVDRTYTTPHIQHTPLEPHTCLSYMKNGRLIIHTSIQTPFHAQRIIANILDIPENKVRVIKEKVGGGFGAKQDVGVEDIAAAITYQTGKRVYIRLTRREEFTLTRTRRPMTIRVKAGADKTGKLTALSIRIVADAGAYGPHCLTVPMNGCSKTLPLFTCKNMAYEVRSYYTNNIIPGAYQGYGVPQGNYAIHMTLAELADRLHMDFTELISKNIVRKGFRLEILKQLGEGKEGLAQKISSCGLAECIRAGRARVRRWEKTRPSADRDVVTGTGTAVMMQGSGLPGIDGANAEIRMLGDGTFMLCIGGADLGTGEDTVAAKIAAEELCVDVDRIAVTAADTDTTPFDKGSYASSGTFFTGSAAYRAALNMRRQIIQASAGILGEKPSSLRMKYPGVVTGRYRKLTYKEIARITQSGTGTGQLITPGAFTTDTSPIPYAAHFARVSLNKLTGMVKVDKYYAVHDCGIPINPDLAKGQVYGAIMKTIGHTFYEQLVFDGEGRCLNPDFSGYPIPGIADLPEEFDVDLVEVADPITPYVGKSISEIACNGASAAIGIALHNAAGIWMRSWPFTPERILKELKKVGREDARAQAVGTG
ncbi:MAG: molybdopterin-dependent oxidoreductase [Candidatus Eisenbacteria bacterium]|nr:molybdopterin-dependent oxidoreductase [Candidatus Eisenbacteria bacterium]